MLPLFSVAGTTFNIFSSFITFNYFIGDIIFNALQALLSICSSFLVSLFFALKIMLEDLLVFIQVLHCGHHHCLSIQASTFRRSLRRYPVWRLQPRPVSMLALNLSATFLEEFPPSSSQSTRWWNYANPSLLFVTSFIQSQAICSGISSFCGSITYCLINIRFQLILVLTQV